MQEQKAVLDELVWYMKNSYFGDQVHFQKGILITIKSLYGLLKYLQDTFDRQYLLTSRVNQDHHEAFIGQLRAADGQGGVTKPNALRLNYRISRYSWGDTERRIPANTAAYHRIPQNTTEYYRIPQNTTEYKTEYHRIPNQIQFLRSLHDLGCF